MICGGLLVWLPFALTLVLICYYKNYFKNILVAFRLPGPPALPLFGHVFLIKNNKEMELLGNNVSHLYGLGVVRFWISAVPIFLVTDPSHLQIILGPSKCSTKNFFYTFLPNLIGEGLVALTGEKWKIHRRLVQPYFHINVLKTFFNVFQKHSENLVHTLKNETDINIVTTINQFILNVMHEVVFGIPINTGEKGANIFRGCKISIFDRICRPWLMFNTVFKMTKKFNEEIHFRNNIQQYTKMLVQMRKKEIEGCQQLCNNSVMDMMLEISKNYPEFTEKDVIDETASFILVGQDSVATSLAFTLYFLAVHQDVQVKVVDELNGIYKNTDHVETFDDIGEMRYLEQCIKESLRLCPTLPLLARTLTKEISLGKETFPPGTNFVISPYATHRLPHVFPNPMKYDPERFSLENKKKIHPYGYIPFSAGPRNCLGYKFALVEMKTVISHILRHYHISITPGYETLSFIYSITLKAKGGIWLRFREKDCK